MSDSPGERARPVPTGSDDPGSEGAAVEDRGGLQAAEVIVVGGGAAGLSAALVLARARRRVVVLDAGSPRNAPAPHVHGLLGQEGVAPSELLRLGREEVGAYGGEVVLAEVDAVVPLTGPDGFEVRTVEGGRWRCRALVVTTGLSDELPALPGVRERWGRDVLHCPYCHGREVAHRRTAVLVTTPGSVHQALLVRQWCDDVVVLAHEHQLPDGDLARLRARGIECVAGRVERLEVDDDRLRAAVLADGHEVPLDVVFVGPVFRGTDTLLLGLGVETQRRGEGSWVVVDDHGRTSVPGLYTAGNVVDPAAQVVDAMAAGSRVGVAVNGDLVDAEVEREVERDAAAP